MTHKVVETILISVCTTTQLVLPGAQLLLQAVVSGQHSIKKKTSSFFFSVEIHHITKDPNMLIK